MKVTALMWGRYKMKNLSVVALCLAIALPALAADNLSKGQAFYNSGQYTQALPYLQDTVSKKPRLWQGHYYLAHTYLALGQRTAAMEQYQLCQSCKPTPEVEAACERVVGRLAATARSGGMPDYSGQSASHQAYLNSQRKRIYNQAMQEGDSMRASTLRAINNGTNSAGGNASLSVSASQADQERATALRIQTELKAKALIDDAHTKMRNMR
jgi:tetratricopeptide (TPR) repeat protein